MSVTNHYGYLMFNIIPMASMDTTKNINNVMIMATMATIGSMATMCAMGSMPLWLCLLDPIGSQYIRAISVTAFICIISPHVQNQI